ncbi:uncharacterized protein LOC134434960 [Engraulis encrasicolus]|uniref:uncharacterized protein LOC134434960 n=1 Tax=Engraulis encrasicolus TaxID=184585 RepID=UPI002FD6B6DB
MEDEDEDVVFGEDSNSKWLSPPFRDIKPNHHHHQQQQQQHHHYQHHHHQGIGTATEDRATQAPEIQPAPGGGHPGPALLLGNGMLPCGLAEEPRRLFHGNAAFRLLQPPHPGEPMVMAMEQEQWGHADHPRQPADHPRQPADHARQPGARNVEVEIGQKLQRIGDQFHQEHLQLFQRNQRHRRQPLWWRVAWAVYSLLFERPAVEAREPR